jgi:CheY-like chemotaxis protein
MENQKAATPKKRVLVVDDDLELTVLYEKLLEDQYEVSTASDGTLALKQVLYQDVDAILCDLRMPELEGDLFYGAVQRAKPGLCDRFIFMTGAADDPKYQPFLSQVKSPILRKPVAPARLLDELKKLLAAPA